MTFTVYDYIVIQMADKFAIPIRTARDALNDMRSYNYKMVSRYFGGVQKLLSEGTTHGEICKHVRYNINNRGVK